MGVFAFMLGLQSEQDFFAERDQRDADARHAWAADPYEHRNCETCGRHTAWTHGLDKKRR